jgi:hypothetical protein
VENAKEYYIKSKPLTIRSDEQTMPTALPDVKLAWNLAYYPYPSTQAILFVPIKDTSLNTNKYCDATMVFLRDSLQNISKRMLVLLMDKNYYNSLNISPTLDNFTGISFQINEDFEAGVLCEYYHGEMYNYLDTCFSQLETNLNTITTRGWPIKCPRFSNSWWESFRSGFGDLLSDFFDWLGDIFNGKGSGTGGGGTGTGNTSGYNGQFGGSGGPSEGNYGSGGGGTSNNNPRINIRDIFGEYELKLITKAIDKLNNYFQVEFDIYQWLLLVDPDCLFEIAGLKQISIDGIGELDCIQEYLKFRDSGLTEEEYTDFLNLLNDPNSFNIDYDPLRQLNECERELTYKNKICAFAIRNNKDLTETQTKKLFGNNYLNDCSDAFRHAYFNALNSISCGSTIAKQFADAHETCNGVNMGPDLEMEMDFFNNNVGRNIAITNPNANNLELSNLVFTALKNGELLYIYPRDPKTYKIIQGSALINTSSNCQ